jgi:hypothetical protein
MSRYTRAETRMGRHTGAANVRSSDRASVTAADAFELSRGRSSQCRGAQHEGGNVAAGSNVHDIAPEPQV